MTNAQDGERVDRRVARVFRDGAGASADDDLAALTPAERMSLVWPVTLQGWLWKDPANGNDLAESRLQRDVVRVYRRER
ncbi:MAG: hypothetical protein M5R36_11720 [Deltaproteobacteria bacterium]|nr:hypothetical protein [Deltaproteobacteria bacterium]